MKTKTLLISTALMLSSGAANAFSIPSGSGFIPGGQFEDNNLDWHFAADGTTAKSGAFAVGDRLISVMEFGTVVDILAPISATQNFDQLNDEMVGYIDIKIKSIVGTHIEFEASAPGADLVRLYSLGGATNFDAATCASFAACSSAVTDGNLWLTLGLVDADDQWFFDSSVGPAGNDSAIVAGLPAITKVGTVNFALSVTGTNNSGYDFLDQALACVPGILFTCAGNGKTAVNGSADILGGTGLSNGAFARSDTDAAFNVPEPATVALLGLGLLGMGASRRNKQA